MTRLVLLALGLSACALHRVAAPVPPTAPLPAPAAAPQPSASGCGDVQSCRALMGDLAAGALRPLLLARNIFPVDSGKESVRLRKYTLRVVPMVRYPDDAPDISRDLPVRDSPIGQCLAQVADVANIQMVNAFTEAPFQWQGEGAVGPVPVVLSGAVADEADVMLRRIERDRSWDSLRYTPPTAPPQLVLKLLVDDHSLVTAAFYEVPVFFGDSSTATPGQENEPGAYTLDRARTFDLVGGIDYTAVLSLRQLCGPEFAEPDDHAERHPIVYSLDDQFRARTQVTVQRAGTRQVLPEGGLIYGGDQVHVGLLANHDAYVYIISISPGYDQRGLLAHDLYWLEKGSQRLSAGQWAHWPSLEGDGYDVLRAGHRDKDGRPDAFFGQETLHVVLSARRLSENEADALFAALQGEDQRGGQGAVDDYLRKSTPRSIVPSGGGTKRDGVTYAVPEIASELSEFNSTLLPGEVIAPLAAFEAGALVWKPVRLTSRPHS